MQIRDEFTRLGLQDVVLTLPSNRFLYPPGAVGTDIDSIAFAANFQNFESFEFGIPGINFSGPSEGLLPSVSPFDFFAGGATSFLNSGLRTAISDVALDIASEAAGFPILVPGRAPSSNSFSQLRSQVGTLKDIGVATKAERRAFLAGEQVVFQRSNLLGTIDGFTQLTDNGLSTIVFSARGRNAAAHFPSAKDY